MKLRGLMHTAKNIRKDSSHDRKGLFHLKDMPKNCVETYKSIYEHCALDEPDPFVIYSSEQYM